ARLPDPARSRGRVRALRGHGARLPEAAVHDRRKARHVALNVDAILFDLGGTVLEIRHDAIDDILARHGFTAAPGWRDRGEREGRRTMESALRRGAPPDAVWRAFFD